MITRKSTYVIIFPLLAFTPPSLSPSPVASTRIRPNGPIYHCIYVTTLTKVISHPLNPDSRPPPTSSLAKDNKQIFLASEAISPGAKLLILSCPFFAKRSSTTLAGARSSPDSYASTKGGEDRGGGEEEIGWTINY